MRINLRYYLLEGMKSFWKNWVMSIAAISTVCVCLIILGAFTIFAFNFDILIKSIESKVEITVDLKDIATSSEVADLQNEISSWSQIEEVRYISKDEAMERLKKDLKDQPELLNEISGNPLPASLEIKLKDPRVVTSVAEKIQGRPGVDEIRYGRDIVKKLFTVTAIARWIVLIFVLLLCFASLVLIVNTIRLAIFARRKEIGIMKLVGATNWFIRWPFVLEGIFQGLTGAALAILILYFANNFFIKTIHEIRFLLPFSFSRILFIELMGGLLGAGILIGAAGSAIALRKFLKV
jgi:cell division transport system permease protein